MTKEQEIIHKTLKEIAESNNFVNYELEIEPISSGGANYTSNLYNITLNEGNNTHHMFAKIAIMPEMVRSLAPNFYHTEIFVYTELSKVYDELQESHEVPLEHRLKLSKFYGCNPVLYEETVVLENLVTKGYESYDRFKSINWEYAVSALTELVKFHALSFAYSEYHSENFKKVLADLKFEYNMKNGAVLDYYHVAKDRSINLVDEKNRDKLKRFFEVFVPEKFMDVFKPIVSTVLVHGDFRPSNLMHKIKENGTVDIKVLDLQTMQASSPVVDFLYFMFTGSDEQFRAQYYDKLVDFYYSELAAAMKRLHLDPEKMYSRIDFDYELKKKLPFGLSIAVFTLPIVTVATEDAPKVNEDMDLSAFSGGKTSDLYTERLNGIVNDYVKWGILK